MFYLETFPIEVFNVIIEHLIVTVGIQKGILLRIVCRYFNAAILEAICVSQVVDLFDPATPSLHCRLDDTIRGKILVVKSRSEKAAIRPFLAVISDVNRTLDILIGETSEELVRHRHESVAKAVSFVDDVVVDAKMRAQNIFCGAIIVGNLPLVQSLLEKEDSLADVNSNTPYFGRPLTLAACHGDIEVFSYLLKCGARPDLFSTRSPPGEEEDRHYREWDLKNTQTFWWISTHRRGPVSALRAAILGGHEKIIRLLLLPQYIIPSSKVEYLRAIMAASRVGNLKLIKDLLVNMRKSVSDLPELADEMIWEAIRYNQKEVVQMLLDNGVDVNAWTWQHRYNFHGTLHLASSLGNVSMIQFLLERGADPNFNICERFGGSPIEGAASHGQEEVVELLLNHGSDPAAGILMAAKDGQPRIIKLLIERFPDLLVRDGGEFGRKLLFYATCSCNLTSITMLVEAGISLNEGYESLWSLPIYLAKEGLGQWLVKHLISLGAQETDGPAYTRDPLPYARGVLVQEHTWQWVSKY